MNEVNNDFKAIYKILSNLEKGLEYLKENNKMKKVKEELQGLIGIVK